MEEKKKLSVQKSMADKKESSDKVSPQGDSSKTKKKISVGKLVGVIVAVVLIALIAFTVIMGLGIYKKRWDKDLKDVPVLGGIVKMYPVMWVDSKLITLSEYWIHVDAMKHFFGDQMSMDFNTEEGQLMMTDIEQQVKDKLRSEAVITQQLDKQGITVTDEDIEAEFQKYLDQLKQQAEAVGQPIENVEEEAIKMFEQQFGWNTKELVLKYAIRPFVERLKLEEKLNEDESFKESSKQLAEEVLKKAQDNPEQFADLAKEYSSDTQSAPAGGELGFFGKGMMVPEFEEVAFGLQPGEVAGAVVETQFGYHIIKVDEIDEENEQVKASHILFVPFESWLKVQEEEMGVSQWL